MRFIGIDPGVAGGIAVLDAHGTVVATHKMPTTERDLLDIFEGLAPTVEPARAVLERGNAGVFGATKFGRMGVTSAFTFGRGIGLLTMGLTAARIPFDLVNAAIWQRSMQCRTGGDKNVSKRRAQQLFPSWLITHANADALLIAEYGRRQYHGPFRLAGVSDHGEAAQQQESERQRAGSGTDEAGAPGNALERAEAARAAGANLARVGTGPRHRPGSVLRITGGDPRSDGGAPRERSGGDAGRAPADAGSADRDAPARRRRDGAGPWR